MNKNQSFEMPDLKKVRFVSNFTGYNCDNPIAPRNERKKPSEFSVGREYLETIYDCDNNGLSTPNMVISSKISK